MNGVLWYTNPPLLLPTPHPVKTKPKPKTITTNQSQSSHPNNPSNATITEIRVCTNRICRRQSSAEILHTLSGISPPYVAVNSCGCLGKCGAGPNIVLLPGPVFLKHCSTPARAARMMVEHVVGLGGEEAELWIKNSLAGLAFRKRAEDEMGDGGDLSRADHLLSQAINLKPCGGVHYLYKVRGAARLMMGNIAEALEDAQEAITQAPKYTEVTHLLCSMAYICQADAFMAIDQYDAAEKSYAMAAELDPSIFRSKSFKARIAKLQEKLIRTDLQ